MCFSWRKWLKTRGAKQCKYAGFAMKVTVRYAKSATLALIKTYIQVFKNTGVLWHLIFL